MSQMDGETSGEIDGFKYRVLMLDPLVATDLIADLGYLLAPVAGPLGGMAMKEKGDIVENIMDGAAPGEETSLDEAFEKAVMGFFDRFSKEKQRELIQAMAKQTTVIMPDGKEPRLTDVFSTHFRGRLKALYRWFGFALKVQFKDFFSGQGNAISQFVERVTERAAS